MCFLMVLSIEIWVFEKRRGRGGKREAKRKRDRKGREIEKERDLQQRARTGMQMAAFLVGKDNRSQL